MSVDPMLEILERAKRKYLADLISMLMDATEADRIELMELLESKFCRGCGRVLNGTRCHCRNDE